MWRARNRFYYQEVERLARQTIPPGARVLELGCGTGDLLAAVRPSFGVGLDVSREMVREARRRTAMVDMAVAWWWRVAGIARTAALRTARARGVSAAGLASRRRSAAARRRR